MADRPDDENDDDDDDDSDADLGAYDVGASDGEGEEAASSPAADHIDDEEEAAWPEVGDRVRARYSEQSKTFRQADVVALDLRARSIAVRFDGWGDVSTLPLSRVEVNRSIRRASPRASPTYGDYADGPRSSGSGGLVGIASISSQPILRSSNAGVSGATGGIVSIRSVRDGGSSSICTAPNPPPDRGDVGLTLGDPDLSVEERNMLRECKRSREESGQGANEPEDRGKRLMQKMGWAPGSALGAKGAETSEAAARPLADFLPMQNDRRGLGAARR